MNVLALLLTTVLYLWIFWGFYVLVMGLYRAHLDQRLTPLTTLLSLPFLIIGTALDVLANMVIATLVFLEPPQEWLVTSRLTRLKAENEWRGDLARWVCTTLLDVFDPSGEHCK